MATSTKSKRSAKSQKYLLPKIAKTIVQDCLGGLTSKDRLLIRYNSGANKLAREVSKIAKSKGAKIETGIDDLKILAKQLTSLGPLNKNVEIELKKLAKPVIDQHLRSTHFATLRCNQDNDILKKVPSDTLKAFWAIRQPKIREKMETIPNVVVHLPSQKEAKIDKVTYKHALDTFFNACLVKPSTILPAQKLLIKFLKGKRKVEILANKNSKGGWYTDLKFSIKGLNFSPLGIKKNFPGFEVHGNAVRYTLSGTLSCRYPVILLGMWLPNIALTFENGKVINCKVKCKNRKCQKWAEKVLAIKGADEVGEFSFGMNPKINYQTVNKLNGEKAWGTVHFALGNSYATSEGINVDNGVRSRVHEDLICNMWPRYGGGMVMVDGIIVQENGKFTGPFKNTVLSKLNPTRS